MGVHDFCGYVKKGAARDPDFSSKIRLLESHFKFQSEVHKGYARAKNEFLELPRIHLPHHRDT